jgi:outer membrane protein assembly factor BamB
VSQAKSIPVQWTPEDYLWKAPLPGSGHGSPVLWGDRVFLVSAEPDTATRYVLAIDAGSGQIVWRRTFPSTTHHLHTRNTYASGTPAVDEQHVYVAWSTPAQLLLRALDHEGNEVWTRDLGSWVSQHGFGGSPIVFEDLVILVNSQQGEQLDPGQTPGTSQVLAFERRTGELRWSTPRTSTSVSYSTPCIYPTATGAPQLICCDTGDGLYSLDPRTGKPLWSNPVFRMRTVASPIVCGDLVLASNGSGGFANNYLMAVRLDTGAEVYGPIKHAGYVPTPIVYDGLVFTYYDSGFVHCFEGPTGTKVWEKRLTRGFSGSPVLIGDKLYCIDDDGIVLVLAASREFQELARNPLGEPSRATPAVAGERLFLRTVSQLICVGAK